MTPSSGRRNRRAAFAIGLLITALTAAAQWLGLFTRLEYVLYDAQFRMAGSSAKAPDSGLIAHIDIDDASLAAYGRWPWPRARLAEAIDELTALNAREIALDIIMPEPQQPRLAASPYGQHFDLVGPSRRIGQDAAEEFIQDDRVLADAIRRSKRVFLSMHFELAENAAGEQPTLAATSPAPGPAAPRESGPAASLKATATASQPGSVVSQNEAASAPSEFGLPVSRNATASAPSASGLPVSRNAPTSAPLPASETPPLTPERLLSPEGKDFVRRRVRRLLDANPAMPATAAAEAIYPSAGFEASPVQDLIFNSYRQAAAMRLVERFSLPESAPVGDVPTASAAVPPIPELAGPACGVGGVSFQPDEDGALRRIPLLIGYGDRVYPQLALLVGCHVLDVKLDELAVDDGCLVLPQALTPSGLRADLRIPLDERRGWMLVNWHGRTDRWQDSFRHLPISVLLDIARNRQLIVENEHRLEIVAGEAVRMVFPEPSAEWRNYVRAYNYLHNAAELANMPRPVREENTAATVAQMAPIERKARTTLLVRFELLRIRTDLTAEEGDELARIREIAEPLFEPAKVRAENDRLRQAIAEQQARLKSLVAGRVCFVGSTATGAADFVPTPLYPRVPGVVVHSNILNTLLTGRFIRQTPAWVNLLALLLCGVAASAITAGLGPRLAALTVFAAMAAVAGFHVLVVFGWLRDWMTLGGPLAAIFLIWGFITAYRQLTEERQRRWVTRALGSYTSPAVAQRIADQPDLLALGGEQRVITCFFSDIKGFTPISERLGPEGTVALLNRYLDRMSEALLRHEATINKFLGDGIFAFFGAPDLQIDHARRAALAALDCRAELARLRREPDQPEAAELAMRIGIATGPAVVGNCGSTQKFDYTAIGDTVNLASRLEAANKFFGTSIILAGPTVEELDLQLVVRPLGRIVVVGKQQAVAVYELLGRLADTDVATRQWADDFAAAIELYAAGKFAEAAKAFEAIVAGRPDDRAGQTYFALCRQWQVRKPGPHWTAAIELTEK